MDSILTVATPATSLELCALRTAKLELGIEDSRFDALLRRWISVGSAQIATFCNRTFGLESVTETWRLPLWKQLQPAFAAAARELKLRRFPVTVISTLAEDGVSLDASLYESDPSVGLLWRLNEQDRRIAFQAFNRIDVAYTAGYQLPDSAPPALQQACTVLLKHRWAARDRDPTLRQESVPNVYEAQYWVGSAGENGALPPEVVDLVNPFRDIRV